MTLYRYSGDTSVPILTEINVLDKFDVIVYCPTNFHPNSQNFCERVGLYS